MNRNLLLIAIAAVVVVGVAAGVLLAGNLSPGDNLSGALFDDTPGPWLYAPWTVIANSANAVTDPVALCIVGQRHEQLHPRKLMNTAEGWKMVTLETTVGTDCYMVSPMKHYTTGPPSDPWQMYEFWGNYRADMLVLAHSVESAPGVVLKTDPNLQYSCVATGTGVPATTADDAYVGHPIVRNDDISYEGCSSGVMLNHEGNTGYYVEALADVASATPSGQNVQVLTYVLRPGFCNMQKQWTFWSDKNLNAPVDFVRANYHPI